MDAAAGIVLGFVGGRRLSDRQRTALAVTLRSGPVRELHHPCLTAADAEAIRMVRRRNRGLKVVAHPQADPARGSVDGVALSAEHRPPKYWVFALRAVVDAADLVIAAVDPPALANPRRDGPWVALRYARKTAKPLIVIGAAGDTTIHDPEAPNGQDVDRVDGPQHQPPAGPAQE